MRTLLLHSQPHLWQQFSRLISAPAAVHINDHNPGGTWDAVIRWDVTDAPDAPITYNASWAVANCTSPATKHKLLMINSVPYRSRYSLKQPIFRIHMVDLMTVRLARLTADGRELRTRLSQRGQNTLYNLAWRALYALGLVFGTVDIAVFTGGKPFVIAVNPAPNIQAELASAYTAAFATSLQRIATHLNQSVTEREQLVIMGADPEFVLRRKHNGALRYASDFFPAQGSVGHDAHRIIVNGTHKYPIAEVRPAPSPSPRLLVDRIHTALNVAARLARDMNTQWLAGAHPHPTLPTGGHVHFSGISLNTFLLRALDNYVALPLFLVENAHTARRRRQRYGRLGEWRAKIHGGFEYRTLSSWLTNRPRTLITLTLAKLAAIHYTELTGHALGSITNQLAFYNGNKQPLRTAAVKLWDELAATGHYPQFSQDLNKLRIMIDERRQWRDNLDLRRCWRIR